MNFNTLSAVLAVKPTLNRRLSLNRTLSAVVAIKPTIVKKMFIKLVAKVGIQPFAFIRLPFGKLPGGAGSVIKRIIQIFDD